MIYYQDAHYLIEWDEVNRWVKATTHHFIPPAARHQGMLQMLEVIKQKSATKMLSDNRESRVIGAEEQQWIREIWLPQVLAVGLRYMAIVLPQSVIAQMSFKAIAQKSTFQPHSQSEPGPSLESHNFSEVAEAEKWLRLLK